MLFLVACVANEGVYSVSLDPETGLKAYPNLIMLEKNQRYPVSLLRFFR